MCAVKNHINSKLLYIIASLALLIAVYAWLAHGYGQPVGFQEYKVSVLPAGLHITNGEFYVLHDNSLFPAFDKHININLNVPNSWIAEWKSDGQLTNPCSEFPSGTNCHDYMAANHQKYQLAAYPLSDPGYFSYDVRFIKKDTEVWIAIAKLKQNVGLATWNSVVDSFQVGHYSGLKAIYGSSSGP